MYNSLSSPEDAYGFLRKRTNFEGFLGEARISATLTCTPFPEEPSNKTDSVHPRAHQSLRTSRGGHLAPPPGEFIGDFCGCVVVVWFAPLTRTGVSVLCCLGFGGARHLRSESGQPKNRLRHRAPPAQSTTPFECADRAAVQTRSGYRHRVEHPRIPGDSERGRFGGRDEHSGQRLRGTTVRTRRTQRTAAGSRTARSAGR